MRAQPPSPSAPRLAPLAKARNPLPNGERGTCPTAIPLPQGGSWGFADTPRTKGGYAFGIVEREGDAPLVLDWRPALEAILADVRAGTTPGAISAAFHAGLALAIAEVAARIGEATVVLSGGCFQNARLTEATIAALRAAGMTPVWHETVPPNDGGLALGQAWWAARHAGGA